MACGVIGILPKNGKNRDFRAELHEPWMSINHRGEISHGLAVLTPSGKLEAHYAKRLVRDSKLFRKPIEGTAVIGQNRYPTSSSGTDSHNNQPFVMKSPSGIPYAVSHNGNIANDRELGAMLKPGGAGGSDTKILSRLLGPAIDASDRPAAITDVLGHVVGSYSLVILIGGKEPEMIAVRDPLGYMPLSVGEGRKGFYAASETVSFDDFGAAPREVRPGELVVMRRDGSSSYQIPAPEQKQYCMFQWVYMLHSVSDFQGANAYEVRHAIGEKIAEKYRPAVDLVLPIPDSGRAASQGYANATGVWQKEGIMKQRYIPKADRGFMQDNHEARIMVVRKKLKSLAKTVGGKSVLTIDDSLVRGNTQPYINQMLFEAGAREVHNAFACPPLIAQCAFGVDFYEDQLLARKLISQVNGNIGMDWPGEAFNKAVAQKLGVTSVYYVTIGDLVDAIGVKSEDLCTSCLTGRYPTGVTLQTEEERRGTIVAAKR